MNMNKALQNLYHAVSNETTTKVNISKLLVDIHYAITGKESENKNNWSKIVNSMADNWPEGGGGGSSDFSTAEVTVVNNTVNNIQFRAPIISNEFNDAEPEFTADATGSTVHEVILYKHSAFIYPAGTILTSAVTTTGNIEVTSRDGGIYVEYMVVTGDCTITIS